MMIRSLLAAALIAAAPSLAVADDAMSGMAMTGGLKSATSPATKAYQHAMQTMHAKTMAMTPTNDPDKDFVLMMKPHHQAAVDMAEAYLKYGTDPKLKAMASDIVASQQKEIGEMNAWEGAHGLAGR